MRTPAFLLALAAALLPAPALADITARYDAGGGRQIVIEVADNGDSRVQIDALIVLTIIHRDGADYVVMRDMDGMEHVARADAVLAVAVGPPPDKAGENPLVFESHRGGSDSVLGYAGVLWTFGPRGETPIEFLISPDPRLIPIGNVFRNWAELIIGATGPMVFDPESFRPIFAEGTPVRISALTASGPAGEVIALQSVSMEAVNPARFTLPGPVLAPEQFLARVMPDPKPAAD